MLDDLRTFDRGIQQHRRHLCIATALDRVRSLVIAPARQRFIDLSEQRDCLRCVRAHHDTIRMQKILDRSSLAQKLRVRYHIEQPLLHAVPLDRSPYPLIRVHRHRALLDDYLVAVDRSGNLARYRFHIREIRIAGLALWRSHCDKDRLRVPRRLRQVGRKPYLAVPVPVQKFRQMIFMDQRVAALQRGHLAFVVVDANHVMTDLGKANRRYQADIP